MKLLGLCLLVAVVSADIPDYFPRCSRSNANIGACFVENANQVLKTLVSGDTTLQIPGVRPSLEHPGAQYQLGDEFLFQMQKTIVTGLDTIQLTDAKINFEERTIFFKFYFTQVDWIGNYVAKGLKNNDEVSDKGHIVYHDNHYQLTLNYTIENDHMVVQKVSIDYLGTPDVDFNLKNLDKHPELQPLMEKAKLGFIRSGTDALEQFIGSVFGAVFKAATFDEIFPPK